MWCSRINRRQRGASLVEMSLILVLFLVLIFGIIEFGMMIYRAATLTEAARAGARYAIVHTPVHTIPGSVNPGDQVGTGVNCIGMESCTGLIREMELLAPAFTTQAGVSVEVVYTVPQTSVDPASPYIVTVSISGVTHHFVMSGIFGIDANVQLPTFSSTRTTESLETLRGHT